MFLKQTPRVMCLNRRGIITHAVKRAQKVSGGAHQSFVITGSLLPSSESYSLLFRLLSFILYHLALCRNGNSFSSSRVWFSDLSDDLCHIYECSSGMQCFQQVTKSLKERSWRQECIRCDPVDKWLQFFTSYAGKHFNEQVNKQGTMLAKTLSSR